MTLIIGDIHGCYNELMALLDKSGITDDEPIIAIGDLADRGNKPAQVLDFFMNTPHATSILGNHEQRHLDAAASGKPPPLSQLLTRWHLGDAYTDALTFIETLPLSIELDDAILVHGYYEPTVPLSEQRKDVLLGSGKGLKHLQKTLSETWFMAYDGEKPLIVGHRDYTQMERPFNYQNRVFGLDTRCVTGGSLTGLRLPQWEFISVPAKKNYWGHIRNNIATDT